MKQLVLLVHRYLGIPMSLLFVTWFVSGIVMMYTKGMPALAPDEMLGLRGVIPLTEVRTTVSDAARVGAFEPRAISIVAVLGRPAFEFTGYRDKTVYVFADNGERFAGAEETDAVAIASAAFGVTPQSARYVSTLTEPDQWTLTEQRHLPLHRVDIDNEARSSVYVSASSGNIVLSTNRWSRALAWIGAIPHWFYFTPLRANQPAWYWTIVWLSVAGSLMAALGLILAFTQFRRSRPFRLSESIRYRGWMKWHYYTGALFGVFSLTWVFSGFLSMEPFEWMNRTGAYVNPGALSGGPIVAGDYDHLTGNRLASLPVIKAVRRIELLRIHGLPYVAVAEADGPARRERLLDARTLEERTTSFDIESILADLADGADAALRSAELMSAYDSIYYDQDGKLPLPVLRVKFDDQLETWVYVDVRRRQIVRQTHRLERIERWLFNGLHSLDFHFWYDRRPLWDLGLILLSLGGLMGSAIGLYLGIQRMARAVSRLSDA